MHDSEATNGLHVKGAMEESLWEEGEGNVRFEMAGSHPAGGGGQAGDLEFKIRTSLKKITMAADPGDVVRIRMTKKNKLERRSL